MTSRIPHLGIVVIACFAAIIGYSSFSVWVVGWSGDPAMIGDVIGTWKSFAVAAFTFWIGSSSGGKTKDSSPLGDVPSGTAEHPINLALHNQDEER